MVKGNRPPLAPVRPRDPVVLDSEPDAAPCAMAHELEFELTGLVSAGIEVHLVPSGDQTWVFEGAHRIGTVDSAAIPGIWSCIGLGWAFNGRIHDVHGDRAVATVRGHRTR